MTERKWTPGPWLVTPKENLCHEICNETKASIAMTKHRGKIGAPERAANAHLIAAAPDLAVIADLVASLPIQDDIADDVPVMGLDGFYITHGDVRTARAALAKAEGRET